MNALEATFLLWFDNPERSTQAAWAAFTDGIESMTTAQVVQRLASCGMEVSHDAVAYLQIECTRQGPDGVMAIWKLHNEHAGRSLDVGDGASNHANIVQQGGAA